MNAESDFIKAERDNVLRTLAMIEDLLANEELSRYETIALGKLLQDVYTGIERILRSRLEQRGIKVPKTESWHKDILVRAHRESLLTEPQLDTFRKLLLFRHLQIHGYGYMLDEQRLRELAVAVPAVCKDFLTSVS